MSKPEFALEAYDLAIKVTPLSPIQALAIQHALEAAWESGRLDAQRAQIRSNAREEDGNE